jgi:hypothetical protein
MVTIKDNVSAILDKSERGRNDDKYLMLLFWNRVDGIKLKDNNNFVEDFLTKATSPSSIIRARCLIQEEGLYPPTEETAARRRSREKSMRKGINVLREVSETDEYSDLYDD